MRTSGSPSPLEWVTGASRRFNGRAEKYGSRRPSDPARMTAGVPLEKLNTDLAIPACESAVRQYPNSIRLSFQLGRAYEMKKDFTSALVQYQKAAEGGNLGAQNNLGKMYALGEGVAQDYAEAMKWYRKAADQDLAIAKRAVAELDSMLGNQPKAIFTLPGMLGNQPKATLPKAKLPDMRDQPIFTSPASRLPKEQKAVVRIEGLRQAFPNGGLTAMGLMGCRDPANTLLWLNIITGRLYDREVQDGTRRRRVLATYEEVSRGLGGFSHLTPGGGEPPCEEWPDGNLVTVEAEKVWGGTNMLCVGWGGVTHGDGTCYWVPASAMTRLGLQ